MRLALGRLRMTPATFWSMTPRELEAVVLGALGETSGIEPLGRQALAALMQQFPD